MRREVAGSLAGVCRQLGLPWAATAFQHASLGAAVRVQYAAVVETRVQTLQRRCMHAAGPQLLLQSRIPMLA